jgi:predicted metal-dependent peptidase
VLPGELEREWFPDQPHADLEATIRQVERVAAHAVSLEQIEARARTSAAEVSRALRQGGSGSDPGDMTAYVEVLRTLYRPPWELALHRWMDAVAPGARTYTRASRRGADRTDVVLPGRLRDGWTLSIVLDTSGSMADELGRALGAIAAFCEGASVDSVRVVQCDVEVTSDEIVAPATLEQYQISGFGGSDMSPALWHLAADPEVTAAIVITDGDIDYPSAPMPYDVLWVLTDVADGFEPPYGQVIVLAP